MKTYTIPERATVIYNTVLDVFNWNKKSDCVTPWELVQSQFQGIPTTGKLCVPGAGIGTYVNAALQAGFLPENITAVEIDPMYYELGSGMFNRLGVTYVQADFLTWEPEMKFDVVIGNPPFQEVINDKRKDQASNLWTKFWLKSLELTTEDGLVSLITPTSWLSPSANLRGSLKYLGKTRLWDVFNSFTSVAQVSGLDRFFKGVGSSFGVVTVNKSGSEGLSFKEGYDTSLGFLPKSEVEEVILKINGKQTLGSLFSITQDCGSGWRVSTPLTRKVNDDSVEILKDSEIPLSGSSNLGLYLYTNVTSNAEAEQVREVILNARDILNVHCRWSGFMNIQIFKKLTVQ